jgi:hypothetical protein
LKNLSFHLENILSLCTHMTPLTRGESDKERGEEVEGWGGRERGPQSSL